ncbi:MAG: hypothetical protein R2874_05245 [Desulfobacterales bacterium]
MDFKQILSALTVDLGHAYNAKGVSVLLLDEARRTLTPVASHGIDSTLVDAEVRSDDKTIRQTLAGETVLLMMSHTTVCLTRRYTEKRRLQPF